MRIYFSGLTYYFHDQGELAHSANLSPFEVDELQNCDAKCVQSPKGLNCYSLLLFEKRRMLVAEY